MSSDRNLTEEEAMLQRAVEDCPDAEQQAAVLVRMREGMGSLSRVLKAVEAARGRVLHLETRASRTSGAQLDALLRVSMTRTGLQQLVRALRQSSSFAGLQLLADDRLAAATPWFPRHASDLDHCNHLMTKYEPELDMNHPGFADGEYRARRKDIAEIAFAYKYGDPIPFISYSESENATWRRVFDTVLELMPEHACREYKAAFAKLQADDIFVPHRIPQLEEVSGFLRKHTGFSLRPAAGLLTARDFLASLAFRVFQSTQYVRHYNSPFHTPEPWVSATI